MWLIDVCGTILDESLKKMKPAKSAQGEEQGELYQRRLSTLLDQTHPLYVLAAAIDWKFFERGLGGCTWSRRAAGIADAVASGAALLETSLRRER